jgi:hypothetical protein
MTFCRILLFGIASFLPNAEVVRVRIGQIDNDLMYARSEHRVRNCWIKKMIFEKTKVLFAIENILYL